MWGVVTFGVWKSANYSDVIAGGAAVAMFALEVLKALPLRG